MCGRYAFYQRPSVVRQQLEESNMRCESAPEDDDVRQSYNFAPGYNGLVYRADVPDHGAGPANDHSTQGVDPDHDHTPNASNITKSTDSDAEAKGDSDSSQIAYKLQAMKWGLVPFWTKRNPEYGSLMKTINCRDDSLIENRGMWTSMKRKKRCIVICQGFYEWLKKNGGKEKIPHFVKRKDRQLMCMAGLWDCVKYEGSDEKLYTYTVITTDSNKQLKFLHDRMPVILENGSEAIRTWLDPSRYEWSKKLQSLLKSYDGELEIYPVSKDVGKVGNNSPTFIIPVDSTENKSNIANFFGNQKKIAKGQAVKKEMKEVEKEIGTKGIKVEQESEENRDTKDIEHTEDNVPLPVSVSADNKEDQKRKIGQFEEGGTADDTPPKKSLKTEKINQSPSKPCRNTKSATSNGSIAKHSQTKASDGSKKITAFFGK
ncbi:DUF159-domain-containing protein [Patellaria atrata CBS 101060]|uniref:DUF159-domain-containing protein n=1 Tax=Patellaria atrata CBS 101060 TaxID=1346257 RepID=A0A9P4VTW7_9PEZI|nr:DUF159-domain-containing protein [Patellaria atrata CBS 101060]